MEPEPLEHDRVSLVGYEELDGRPAFKIGFHRDGDRWFAYLSHWWHSGWSIVDVTDPTDPALVRFVEGPENTATQQLQVADGLLVTALERPSAKFPLGDGTADPSAPYAAGAYLWDLEGDPTNPELVGHYDTGGRGTHRNFYAGGDYAYMCASPEGFEPAISDPLTKPVKNFHLRIVDVSDPGDIKEVGVWLAPGQPPDDGTAPKNFYFHGPAWVEGERAYLSYGRYGLVVLDIADVRAPVELTQLDLGPGLGGFLGVHSCIPVPDTDIAVVNSEAYLEGDPLDPEAGEPLGYTCLVGVADERPPGFDGVHHRGPRVVSWVPMPKPEAHLPYTTYYEKSGRFGPHNQHHPRPGDCRLVTSELLFMTYFNAGLRVFDISNPLDPHEVGYWVPEEPPRAVGPRPQQPGGSHLEDVAVDARGYLYCTDPNRGLMVLETDLV